MSDSVFIGVDAAGRRLFLSPDVRRRTHMHVIGGSGTGKSKFLEWLIREDIKSRRGLCVIDWHGSLCDDILAWCHHRDIGIYEDTRPLIILNPSKPEFVTGFNPFVSDGGDISTQISNRIDATIRPWGITNTNEMPTFERVCRALFAFMIEAGETLPNAAKLLEFDAHGLREYAIREVREPLAASIWRELERISVDKKSGEREWRQYVLSTENRLARFVGSLAVRRFMGLRAGNINLGAAMDQGSIILVNLGRSQFLPVEAGRVFASLLLNQFFEATMRRANAGIEPPRPFTLYLDEFQEYITDDIADMLDQVRKGGLQLVLAHQHLGHFADNPRLKESVFTNARIRAVFGGLTYTSACELANEMFLPDLNTRQIKKAYYHTIHLYREELRSHHSHTSGTSTSRSTSRSSGAGYSQSSSESSGAGESAGGAVMMPPTTDEQTEGWFTESSGSSSFYAAGSSEGESEFESESESTGESTSETEGVTTVPVFVPMPVQELGSESEWSLEEKRAKIAEMLKCQQQRHCFIKIDTEPTQPLRVPDVLAHYVLPGTLSEYAALVYRRQGGVAAEEVDKLLRESEREFIERALSGGRPADSSARGAEAQEAATAAESLVDDDLFDAGPEFTARNG